MFSRTLALCRRSYSVAASSVGSEKVSSSIANTLTNTVRDTLRETLKTESSRKTYLVDAYTHILKNSPVLLVAHNNTLLKNDDRALRSLISKAGGRLHVIRPRLFKVALRGLEHADPASKEANRLHKKTHHPLAPLCCGPTAVISFDSIDPKAVEGTVKAMEKYVDKIALIGGQIDGAAVDRLGIDKFKALPSLEQLRADLLGILTMLSGAGLVKTLESSQNMLYLTLKEHEKAIKGESEEKE